jgi:hypothetical protein
MILPLRRHVGIKKSTSVRYLNRQFDWTIFSERQQVRET